MSSSIAFVLVLLTFACLPSTTVACGIEKSVDLHGWQCSYNFLFCSDDISIEKELTFPSTVLNFNYLLLLKMNVSSSLLVSVRESCDHNLFNSNLAMQSSMNSLTNYYFILESESDSDACSLVHNFCTYYFVIQAPDIMLEDETKKCISVSFDISLAILLEFHDQYKYSYSNTNYDSNERSDDNLRNSSKVCYQREMYAIAPSESDFPIGVIIQPEVLVSDSKITISHLTANGMVDESTVSTSTYKGNAITYSYEIPSDFSSMSYLIFVVSKASSLSYEYQIKFQPNLASIEAIVMNSAGWFLLLILMILTLIVLLRKYCCHDRHSDILSHIRSNVWINIGESDTSSNDKSGNGNCGATSVELDALPLLTFNKQVKKQMRKQQSAKCPSCCICLQSYKYRDSIRSLKCNHVFHQQCVDAWLKQKKHCPLCKQKISDAKSLMLSANIDCNVQHTNNTTSSSNTTTTTNSTSSVNCSSSAVDDDDSHISKDGCQKELEIEFGNTTGDVNQTPSLSLNNHQISHETQNTLRYRNHSSHSISNVEMSPIYSIVTNNTVSTNTKSMSYSMSNHSSQTPELTATFTS